MARMLALSKNIAQASGSVYTSYKQTSFISPLSPSYWPKRFLPSLLQWLLTVSCSEMKLGSNWRYSKNCYRLCTGFLERSSKMFWQTKCGIKKRDCVPRSLFWRRQLLGGGQSRHFTPHFMYLCGGQSSRIIPLAISLLLHSSHRAENIWVWWVREKDWAWVAQPLPGSTSNLPACRSLDPELRGLSGRGLQGWVWLPCR